MLDLADVRQNRRGCAWNAGVTTYAGLAFIIVDVHDGCELGDDRDRIPMPISLMAGTGFPCLGQLTRDSCVRIGFAALGEFIIAFGFRSQAYEDRGGG